MSNGYILYDGKSLIDGKPIVAIATIDSSNKKTGAMVQTWILRSDIDPVTASRTGQDYSICGNCPHKGKPSNKDSGQAINRTCYVNLIFAPNNIYKSYKRGIYKDATTHKDIRAIGLLRGVRLGSYGDPLAVPKYIWDSLTCSSEYVTAYTHQSNTMPQYIMTSADNLQQAESAWSRNERTFRVISSIDKLVKGKEILCPASKEAGERVQCAQCKLCGGNSVKGKSVAIVAHGTSKRKAKELVE
jgi:hypothetical protein